MTNYIYNGVSFTEGDRILAVQDEKGKEKVEFIANSDYSSLQVRLDSLMPNAAREGHVDFRFGGIPIGDFEYYADTIKVLDKDKAKGGIKLEGLISLTPEEIKVGDKIVCLNTEYGCLAEFKVEEEYLIHKNSSIIVCAPSSGMEFHFDSKAILVGKRKRK